MLNEQVLDIIFLQILLLETVAASELALHTHGVHDGDDAIQTRNTLYHIFVAHRGDGTDGAGDGFGFADAAGLDNDVVEALHLHNVAQLLNKVHLERAADAAVLKGDKALFLLPHDAPLLDEVGIDIDFTYIIDNNRKADAPLIGKDAVDKGCLSAA